MKPAAYTAAVWILCLGLGALAWADERARIADIRMGRHPSFDRLVIELERDVEVWRLPEAEDGAFQLEFDARPLLPHQQLKTRFKRMGSVVVEAVPAGTRLRVEARPRRVRVFRLSAPARIVVDFGDPGPEPFPAPEGTLPVPERPEEPALELEAPAPTQAEAPKVRVVLAPSPEPEPPEVEVVPAPSPKPESSTQVVESETPAALAQAAETPARVPEVLEAAPEPGPAKRAWFERLDARNVIGAAVLLMGLAFIALYRSRSSRRRRERAASESAARRWPRAPESITPEEIAGADEQVNLVDRRIDEEVRARMHLEERLAQVQEELKVMRDRLQ